MAETAQVLPLHRTEEPPRRVALCGPFRVSDAHGRDLTPRGRKTRALLAHVLLTRGPVRRERLAAMFWGDRGEEQAKASLRQALYELRELAAGPRPLLTVGRDDVAAAPDAFALDLDEMFARAGNDAGRLADEIERSDLKLLADLDAASADFDDWLAGERTRRLERLTATALAAGREALDAGRAADSQRLADALEQLDPLDEPAVRLGLAADRATGDLAGLHRRYRRFAERLRAELDAEPAEETRALLQPAAARSPASPPAAEAAQDAAPSRRRFVWLGVVAAVLLALGVAGALAWPRLAPPPRSPSLAVLPFGGYFGSGVSEAVLDLVARDAKVRIVGATSARQFASARDPLAAARRAGVAYVLTGQAQQGSGRIKLTARLVRAKDGRAVWSGRFNRPVEDVFAVQNEVAMAVAQHLGARVAPSADPHRVTRPEVYDRYLQAVGLARERRASTLAEARRLLLEAAALDPNYAPTFASLAEVTMLLADHPTSYGDIPYERAQADARTYARRALELSPTLGEAYAAYGLISLSDVESLPFYERAVALDPQRADFHRWLGNTYQVVGRHNEALAEFQRAAALEPVWALCSEHLVGQLGFMGRFDEAQAVVDRFARVSSDPRAIGRVRLSLLEGEGRLAEHLALTQQLAGRAASDRNDAVPEAKAWALLGENARAARALAGRDEVGRLALTGDAAGLARLAQTRSDSFWALEPGYWGQAEVLVKGGRGPLLLKLFDREFTSVPDFVEREPLQALSVGPALIAALNEAGRRAEAEDLARRLLARLDLEVKNGAWATNAAVPRATILATIGRRDEALALLETVARENWALLLWLPYQRLADSVAWRGLAGDPRLTAVQAQLDAKMNAQRAIVGLPPLKN